MEEAKIQMIIKAPTLTSISVIKENTKLKAVGEVSHIKT